MDLDSRTGTHAVRHLFVYKQTQLTSQVLLRPQSLYGPLRNFLTDIELTGSV